MALKHSVYDTDTHFSINPITRTLRNEASSKTGLIQYDHDSERFTFEIPRVVEGHDMSLCDIVQVHYNNIDSNTKAQSKGVYVVEDMQISPDGDDVVILSWLISSNATKYVGSLNFLVRFACTNDEGQVCYVWNTAVYSGISVSTGIDNGEAVVEEYADILQTWYQELIAASDSGVNAINEAKEAAIADIEIVSGALANAIKETASGEVVGLTDVSPIGHEMGVKVRGRNLLSSDIWGEDVFEKQEDGSYKSITKISTDGTTRDFYLPAGVYTFSVWIKSAEGTNFRLGVIYEDDTRDDHYDKSTGDYILNRLVTNGKAIKQILWYYGASGDGLQFKELQAEVGNIAQADIVYTPYIEDISAVKVKKCGKNLIDISKAVNGNLVQNENGTYTITKNGGNRFSAKVPVFIPKGCKFGVTPINPVDNAPVHSLCFQLHLDGASSQTYSMKIGGTVAATRPVVGNANVVGITFYLNNEEADGANYSFSDLQIEFGEVFTGIEPYKGLTEYPVNADGIVEGVTSLHPTTTLIPDTDGVHIEAEYNKDTNKVFTDLSNKVNSLLEAVAEGLAL